MNTVIFTSLTQEDFKNALKDAVREVMNETGSPQKNSVPDILSIGEAASFLKLKVNTLYEKTSLKSIPHFKKGNKLYFHRTELEKWITEGKVKTRTEIEGEAVTFLMNGAANN